MKLEKRDAELPESKAPSPAQTDEPMEISDSTQTTKAAAPSPPKSGSKKPVIVYIMILFIVAFLLMALSFAMHQRSNQEVLGELHSNVNALEQLQDVLDENLVLQQKVKALQKEAEDLSAEKTSLLDEITGYGDSIADLQSQIDALEQLYTLQQQYAAQDYDACNGTLSSMEDSGAAQRLPTDSPADHVVSPAQRYQQLKDAIERK